MLNGRFWSYLNTAKLLIENYEGDIPFHHYIKQYFRENSKYGSRDRKQISALCYSYYRAGRALAALPMDERIRISWFLCSDQPGDMLAFFNEDWNMAAGSGPREKINIINASSIDSPIRIDEIFPFPDRLSKPITEDKEEFMLSHLQQPHLFLRMRPGRESTILYKLKKAGIIFEVSGSAIILQNNTDISSILDTDREAVVQDLSSQQTGDFIREAGAAITGRMKGPLVWDCCAASGGKSLLAFDIIGNMELTVSDVRKSILENLQERFNKAGVKTYQSMMADLSKPLKGVKPLYDMIIADVPCSGSGTWGRTPEEMHFFSAEKLAEYAALQKQIIANTVPALLPGGQFLYLTCSVYEEENEAAIDFMVRQLGYRLNRMGNIKGYYHRADTMFAAWLTSPA